MADKKISALTASTTPLAGTEVLPIVQGGSTVKVSIANVTAGRAVDALTVSTTTGFKNTSAGSDIASPANGVILTDGANKNAIVQLGASGGLSTFVYEAGGAGWRRVAALLTNGNSVVDVGNLVIGTAGKGIDFSANTHAAGMTSELLNDYEEGTFTATLTGSSTAPTTPVTATAYYTKIGRLVTCNILFSSVDTTGASGAILISGLPFTPALIRSVGACNMGGMGAVAAVSIVSSGTTTMEIWDATQVNNILISAGTGKTVNTTISYLV